jgi:PadR family transcriptional regulator, regulatory protein AphA
MPLRHALLGLLASKPQTGYELTRMFDRSLRNAWHASHSQVYPELARLEALGMIEVVAEGARGSRTWAVTPAGRDELRRWLTETEPSRAVRNESAVRWFLIFLLEPAERIAVLERDLAHLEERRAELDEISAQIAAAPHGSPFAPVVDVGQRIDTVMQAWLREQIAIARAG